MPLHPVGSSANIHRRVLLVPRLLVLRLLVLRLLVLRLLVLRLLVLPKHRWVTRASTTATMDAQSGAPGFNTQMRPNGRRNGSRDLHRAPPCSALLDRIGR